MTTPDAASKRPLNPWMLVLTLLWSGLLAVALLLVYLAATAGSMTYDQPGLPPSAELAGIYYACSGVTVCVAAIVIAVQLGVGALRWHLDPASRYVPPAPAPPAARVRNDF